MQPHSATPEGTLQGIWLEFPTLARHVIEGVVEVSVTLALAVAVLRLVPALERWVVRRASVHGVQSQEEPGVSFTEHQQRVETLVRVTVSITRGVVLTCAAISILAAVGVNVGPLLAGAGVAGVAVGFGAQSIVKDFFAGFCILFENQYAVGDTVTVAGVTGVVERMTMRVTVVRDLQGAVHFIQNGNVGNVTNSTYGWLRTSVDVSAPVGLLPANVRRALEAIAKRAGDDPDAADSLLDPVEVLGPLEFTGTAVTWRLQARTRARAAADVRSAIIASLQHDLGSEADVGALQWNRVRTEAPGATSGPAT